MYNYNYTQKLESSIFEYSISILTVVVLEDISSFSSVVGSGGEVRVTARQPAH